MKMKNKKGFTLIELLAVIIILAILMTLAITSMSGYIRKAKKDTFVTTAQQYAGAARLSIVNGEYANPGQGQCTVISTDNIALESGTHESPFDSAYDTALSYIVVKNKGTGEKDEYEYYIQMVDTAKNGFILVSENDLTGNLVKEKVITTTNSDTTKKAVAKPSDGANLTLPGASNTCTVLKAY